MSNPCRLRVVHLLLLLLTILTTLAEGQLAKWNFANFSSSLATVRDSIVLLGDAAIVNTTGPPRLVLNGRGSQTGVATAGRVVYSSPVQFKDDLTRIFVSFSTNFTFTITDPGLPKPVGCGGFTFYIRGDNNSVGESGEYLGLTTEANDGLTSNRLLAVEFDTSISNIPGGDPSPAHIGLDVNGVKSDSTYDLCPGTPDCTVLVNRGDYLAKIAYDSSKEALSVELYLNTTNLVANWTAPKLSLEPIFQNYMYVGFTGSNGVFCNQTHTIYSWSFSTSRPPSSKPKSPEAPALHTSYDCYKFDGCNNYRALIIGVPVAVGGCALIFLMICIYCVYCRKTQKNPEYKAVDVSGPNSGPQTGGDNAVKVNAKSASAHELPAPLVNIALPLCHGKDKDPQDPKPTDFAPVAGQPSVTASSISMEPKPEVPVVESVDRNPHGKVTMCCVQTKPKRDYKDTIVFSAKELAQATKNFSEKVIIGTPGRKPVYKGVLRDNGAEVAIKEIALNNISNEFVSKAMLLGRIRHPNLVHLLGWCKCEEKRKLYLVYDYMPRGSMDKLLLLSKDADGFLGFDARYNVLVGVAAGLNCLHAEWEQCVLHRDVKPSNVYLDAMFNAHVGNFSLASLVDHDKVAHSTVMDGTLGYMAPEIPFTGKPTMKSDVFSYGILVLEVACGRLPLDWHLPQEERVLLDCVWRAREEGDIARVADKRLENTYSEKQMATLLQIGLNCAHPDPSMRPNMAFVWKVLIGGAEPPELPAKKPVIENYAALSSLGTMRNSASRGNLGSTSSDTQ
ncbi:probable L-type lectin-domain containing receptor kinase S.7 [Physcomitrium patens]|uniref:non-specific serine/threonine protein kinase n=1 Tax=Physcomitrium patens TaxID=3218 RepID=A0A2K1JS68_PHYPA|nr:probable L-type lectin-domain containing receptor kinase S.7 [Physcomitrium patens]PNR44379.1 hypothetical protein PHYPA_016763 [Physcomitrium patens]|eukprot:XP_024391394.1 probable L-type lectin-domain containing receptor kinase S.7 [Physcomitrella patens]